MRCLQPSRKPQYNALEWPGGALHSYPQVSLRIRPTTHRVEGIFLPISSRANSCYSYFHRTG